MGTILDQLPDFGDVDRLEPVHSVASNLHSSDTTDLYSTEAAGTHQQTSQQHYDCVIVGGGQSGLCTAGRLQALGVSYICIDSNDEIGDSWRLRYDSSKSMLEFYFYGNSC
jgi:heterodisulfide reductase subunit A-like polyferredoxin